MHSVSLQQSSQIGRRMKTVVEERTRSDDEKYDENDDEKYLDAETDAVPGPPTVVIMPTVRLSGRD